MVACALRLAACAAALLRSESQSGPPDPIFPGLPCDPHRCECGKLDLTQFKGHVYETPPDRRGLRVRFKMCENLTKAELPDGCQAEPLQSPSSVLYDQSNESVCQQIGSFGPCWGENPLEPMQCGMTFNDSRADGGEILLTWQLEHGCINTFRVALSAGKDKAPKDAAAEDPQDPNPCYWLTHWAGFSIPSTPTPTPLPPSRATVSASTLVVAIAMFVALLGAARIWQRRRARRSSSEQLLDEPSSVAVSRDGGLSGAE